jgi:hypothetical protein
MGLEHKQQYHIQTHGNEFVAGVQPDGVQVLLVPTTPAHMAKVLFDSAGSLIVAEEQTGTLEKSGYGATLAVPSAREIRIGTITVASFLLPSFGIGIRQKPDEFDRFLLDPLAYEPDHRYRERTYSQIQEWIAQDRFVLTTWGKEYWMNADGSVFAT